MRKLAFLVGLLLFSSIGLADSFNDRLQAIENLVNHESESIQKLGWLSLAHFIEKLPEKEFKPLESKLHELTNSGLKSSVVESQVALLSYYRKQPTKVDDTIKETFQFIFDKSLSSEAKVKFQVALVAFLERDQSLPLSTWGFSPEWIKSYYFTRNKTDLSYVFALLFLKDTGAAEKILGTQWILPTIDVLLSCAANTEPKNRLLAVSCQKTLQKLPKGSLDFVSPPKMWATLLPQLKGFRIADKSTMKHQEIKTQISKDSYLESEGIKVNLQKSNPVPNKPDTFICEGSTVELGKYNFMAYSYGIGEGTPKKLTFLPVNDFKLSWQDVMEPGGKAKVTFQTSMAVKVPSGSLWVAVSPQYPWNGINSTHSLSIICQRGCLSRVPVAKEIRVLDDKSRGLPYEEHWTYFPVYPGTEVIELYSQLDAPTQPRAAKSGPQDSLKLSAIPIPEIKDGISHWVSPLETNLAKHFPELDILNLKSVAKSEDKKFGDYGVMTYIGNLYRELEPKGWIRNENRSPIALQTLHSFNRLKILFEKSKEQYLSTTEPLEETKENPWKQKYALLARSSPNLVKRLHDEFVPQLEKHIETLDQEQWILEGVQAKIETSLNQLEKLTLQEKVDSLGRISTALNSPKDKIASLNSHAALSEAIIGAKWELDNFVANKKSEKELSCQVLEKLNYIPEDAKAFPGIKFAVSESVLKKLCKIALP